MRIVVLWILFLLYFSSAFSQEEGKRIGSMRVLGVYTSLPWYNFRGGVDQGFVYMDNLDISATYQLGNILDWKDNFIFYLYSIGNHGQKASKLMGDFQIASNIESPKSWKIFEAWAQKNFLNGQLSLLAGMYDLNSEFDVLIPATSFINSSFGIGGEFAQSGLNGPSIFPYSSLAIRVSGVLSERIQLKAAVLDGVSGNPSRPNANPINLMISDGVLIASELSVFSENSGMQSKKNNERKDISRRIKVGRIKPENNFNKINVGIWSYTSEFELINDSLRKEKGNLGAYLGFQRYINFKATSVSYISIFGRAGLANGNFNQLNSSFSGGLTIYEIFGNDLIGLAFSKVSNGKKFLEINSNLKRSETAFEFTYSYFINNFMTIQPDLQFILNPSMRNDLENAFAFSLLFQISYAY